MFLSRSSSCLFSFVIIAVHEDESTAYQVLVVEKMDHSRCPFSHWYQVRRSPVQPQQAQCCALLHTVHGVPDEDQRYEWLGHSHSESSTRRAGQGRAGQSNSIISNWNSRRQTWISKVKIFHMNPNWLFMYFVPIQTRKTSISAFWQSDQTVAVPDQCNSSSCLLVLLRAKYNYTAGQLWHLW